MQFQQYSYWWNWYWWNSWCFTCYCNFSSLFVCIVAIPCSGSIHHFLSSTWNWIGFELNTQNHVVFWYVPLCSFLCPQMSSYAAIKLAIFFKSYLSLCGWYLELCKQLYYCRDYDIFGVDIRAMHVTNEYYNLSNQWTCHYNSRVSYIAWGLWKITDTLCTWRISLSLSDFY